MIKYKNLTDEASDPFFIQNFRRIRSLIYFVFAISGYLTMIKKYWIRFFAFFRIHRCAMSQNTFSWRYSTAAISCYTSVFNRPLSAVPPVPRGFENHALYASDCSSAHGRRFSGPDFFIFSILLPEVTLSLINVNEPITLSKYRSIDWDLPQSADDCQFRHFCVSYKCNLFTSLAFFRGAALAVSALHY